MINYFYDCYRILNKVYQEKTFIKQAISSTAIEEKNRALTIKTCYGVLERDIELSFYLKALTQKSPKAVVRIILKIAVYAIKYLQKPPYAVTKNAVELLKKMGKGGMSGFVNAFLRSFVNQDFQFPTEESEKLSIIYSYPLFAVKELINSYGVEETKKIIQPTTVKTSIWFNGVDGKEYLNRFNIKFEETPYEGVYLAENFLRNSDYDKGLYTYQALGSIAICDEILSCDKLLDCCAAPGGKSIRLSYKCKEVYSWDIYQHRVNLITDYKTRMKRENVFERLNNAEIFNPLFNEKFDAVLCDAPCSGLGVVNDNPDIKLNRTIEGVNQLNLTQKNILSTVSKYVKKGGYLYYSTCSILSRENIEIIRSFMSDINGFEIVNISPKLPHKDIDGTAQFLPHISGGLGFYLAKLKRVK